MSNTYANDELAKATQIAQFRFALIAPVVQGLFSETSATEYYKRITQKPLTVPDLRQPWHCSSPYPCP